MAVHSLVQPLAVNRPSRSPICGSDFFFLAIKRMCNHLQMLMQTRNVTVKMYNGLKGFYLELKPEHQNL